MTSPSSLLTQDKSNSVLLTLSCFTAAFPHYFHCEPWVIAGTGFAMLWRLWIIISGKKLPSPLLLLPFVSLMMAGVWFNFQSFLGKEAGITMLVLLISCKLLEMHAKRDLYVAVFLAFFLLITGYLYNQTIFSAIFSTFSVLLLTTALNTYQFTAAIPPLTVRLTSSFKLLLSAIPLMLIGFFLFPRIPGPLWSLPGDSGQGKTGLSDSLNPGNISELAMNEEIAFRVKFIDYPKDKSVLYWRGIVLDEFDGRSWKASMQRSAPQNPAQLNTELRGAPLNYVITLEPHQRKWLFAMDLPVLSAKSMVQDSYLTANMELRSENPVVSRLKYSLRSYPSYLFDKQISAAEKENNIRLPGNTNPKTRLHATNLRRQFADDTKLISAVLSGFAKDKFEYTLQPGKSGTHAIDEFFFEKKKGFCEHYASAFTFIMRQAGIPARIVTGYQGGMQNPVDDYFEVRQSDAHAWSEVWLRDQGWVRIDPTAMIAPERIHQSFFQPNGRRGFAAVVSSVFQNQTWPQYLQMYWDATNNEWNQWILSYGQQKQENLFQRFEWLQLDWQRSAFIASTVFTLVFAAFALMSYRKKNPLPAIERTYQKLCLHLRQHGAEKNQYESPTQFLKRVKQTLPVSAHENLDAFISRYSDYCYARSSSNQHQLNKELNYLLKKIKNEIK